MANAKILSRMEEEDLRMRERAVSTRRGWRNSRDVAKPNSRKLLFGRKGAVF